MAFFLTLLCLIFSSTASFAAPPSFIGYRQNSETGANDYCTKFQDESGTVVNRKCLPVYVSDGFITDEGNFFLIRAGLANGGGTSMTTNQTAVDPSYNYIAKHIASDPAFSTGTLPDGQRGSVLTIQIVEVQAGGTWTLTPDTSTGFVSLVFEAVGDLVTLLYVDDPTGWIIISQESVQLVN